VNTTLGTLGVILAAWLSFTAATSLAVTLAWRTRHRWFQRMHPAHRAGIALAIAALPSAAPTLLVLVCLEPGLAELAGWHSDHCLSHADHLHLCVVHARAALHAPEVLVLVLVGAAIASGLFRGAREIVRTRRFVAALRSRAEPALGRDVRVVASEHPFSFATRWMRGEVWVSSALADAVSRDHLDVVLAHERAHLERHDPLCRAVAAALSFPLWPSVRRSVLSELNLASEQACDEAAGCLHVAETILTVERLAGATVHPTPPELPAFGGCAVSRRVEGLLEPEREAPALRAACSTVFVLTVAALVLMADPLHHATEHWLRLVLGTR
jgi:beta-lactamase regulating signal transducer with metallopeptidase domain